MAGKTAMQYARMSQAEFDSMTLAEINTALKKITKAERQNYARVKASRYYSPAVEGIDKAGHIRTGFKELSKARTELKRGIEFLTHSTRTIPGAKAHHEQAAEYAGLPPTVDKDTLAEIFKARDRILEGFPGQADKVLNRHYSNVENEIFEKLRNGDSEADILQDLMDEYETLKDKEAQETARYERNFS